MSCCGGGGGGDTKVGAEGEPDGGKFGKPIEHDPNFKGPIKKRSCTDIICCFLFIVFVVGQAIVMALAFLYGDPELLILPVNSDGEICGRGTNANKPNLMYFDISRCASVGPAIIFSGGKCPTPSVCIEKCPSANWVWLQLQTLEITGIRSSDRESQLVCLSSVNVTTDNRTVAELIGLQLCAGYYLESEPLSQRCFPSMLIKGGAKLVEAVTNAAGEELKTSDNETLTGNMVNEGSAIYQVTNVAEGIMNDIIKSWITIVVSLALAALVSCMYLLLLRFTAAIIVWSTLLIFFLAFLGSATYCFYRYYLVVSQPPTNGTDYTFQLSASGFNRILDYKESWLAFGITASIFFVIILFILLFLRKRLRLAIGILEEASKAISSMLLTLIFPIFPLVFELAVFGVWAGSFVYLLSIRTTSSSAATTTKTNSNDTSDCGTAYYDVNTLQCNLVKHTGEYWSIILQVYNLFMGLWLFNFVVAVGQITLAGAYASWYWAWEKPKDLPTFPLMSSLYRAFRYHLGSLALGSFIIAVIQIIRIILEYIDSKVKGRSNPIAKFFLCCLKCCFWCLEKIVKFLTKNAYIMIAITGSNFCSSARQAFFLLMRNIIRLVVVDRVTAFVLFVGKLVITGGLTTLAYFFYSHKIPWISLLFAPSNLIYFYIPVILIAIGTFLIASLFFVVYDFAVDTLFLCVMEDLERNDGSPDKPYFMSKNLMKILDKENKFKRDDDDDDDDDENSHSGCCKCC